MSREKILFVGIWIGLFFVGPIYAEQTSTKVHLCDSVSGRESGVSSSLLNWPVIAVPTVSYSPETDWAFGASGSAFFPIKGATRSSEVSVQGCYTLRHQYMFHAQTTCYFGSETGWMFSGNVGYKYYPNIFYGVGSQADGLLAIPLHYNARAFYFMGQPLYCFSSGWQYGGMLQLQNEGVVPSVKLDSVLSRVGVSGYVPFWGMGIGGVVGYDSRSSIYYPLKGLFFKARVSYYGLLRAGNAHMLGVDVDFRQYVRLYRHFVFAWQGVVKGIFGSDIPFQLMPTLGGADLGRGIRQGMWRAPLLVNVQGEFRIPIWRYFKATVFCSVGDVFSEQSNLNGVPKLGYGIGLRVTLLKPAVNVRFDVARNSYNNDWMFYFTLKEAF